MFCCNNKQNKIHAENYKLEAKRNDLIEEELSVNYFYDKYVHKVLVLGAGESGKSTLFKQFKLIYGHKSDAATYRSHVSIVHHNIHSSLMQLITNIDRVTSKLTDEKTIAAVEHVSNTTSNAPIQEYYKEAKIIWQDEEIQDLYKNHRSNFYLYESTKYFLDKLDDINEIDWVPDDQDMLRTRVRTTGIVETSFNIGNETFKVFDVGGQRNERKKWIHCFENVTAVLFLAAISAYDQMLYENASVNRMDEALALFKEICNTRWFLHTSLILFLNKMDIFEDKLLGLSGKAIPITVCPSFVNYKGPEKDFEAAVEFIEDVFLMKNENPDKQVYYHVTCATNTDNIAVVFAAVKDIIIKQGLAIAGLLV